ncbi:MAG: tRNA pseudouridine(38-40) synthase TruA [Alphaproteobacteria bacterium]|nr:tRNA pseudouridine(38-40) synthase TruA [Alphaproteobacteria bacterium]
MLQRYVLEVAYLGTNFAGFQTQKNAIGIQDAIQDALFIITQQRINLTGSSRTDAGVHAQQNFFHFDTIIDIQKKLIFQLNALISPDISCLQIFKVPANFHCRFDVDFREYIYKVHHFKNPFIHKTSYYFPYTLDEKRMQEFCILILETTNFKLFSKKHSDVKTTACKIFSVAWDFTPHVSVFKIRANRFLRGMVKAIVGTSLQIGRGHLSLATLQDAMLHDNNDIIDFSPPSCGLILNRVQLKNFETTIV